MDYVLVVKILAYAGMVRASAKYDLGSVFCAVVAVGVPFLLELLLRFILLSGYNLPLSGLVSAAMLVTFTL